MKQRALLQLFASLTAGGFLLLLALTMPLLARAQGPVGTTFTYQGRLLKNGQTINGATCNFQFDLYDTPAGGSPIAATLAKTAVVSDGYFTVALDFGNVFDGNERFLDIALQCPGDSAFTPLSGRVALNAAPYALSVPWGQISDMPLGFRDRTDNDTLGEVVSTLCSTNPSLSQSIQYARWTGSGWTCDFGIDQHSRLQGLDAPDAHPQYLNLDENDKVTGQPIFANTPAVGNIGGGAPFVVSSTVRVVNLNTDLLDGEDGSFYQNADNINTGTLSFTRYSAYGDLEAEGRLDGTDSGNLLTRSQLDSEYVQENQTAGGDLAGAYPDPTVVKIQGGPVNVTGLAAGDVLEWDGVEWKPAPSGGNALTGGGGINIAGDTISVDLQANGGLEISPNNDNGELRIADDGVTSARIKDGQVMTDDIAASAVTSAKISDNDIQFIDIGANGCDVGELIGRVSGSPNWGCVATSTIDTTYSAGNGIGITGVNNDISIDLYNMGVERSGLEFANNSSDMQLKVKNGNGLQIVATSGELEILTDTNGGLNVTASGIKIQDCPDSQIMKRTGGQWICDADPTATAGEGIIVGNNIISAAFTISNATTAADTGNSNGDSTNVARGNHHHFGQSWTGSGTGLTLSGGGVGLSASGSSTGISASGTGANGVGVSTGGTKADLVLGSSGVISNIGEPRLQLQSTQNLSVVLDHDGDNATAEFAIHYQNASTKVFKVDENGDVYADGGYHCGPQSPSQIITATIGITTVITNLGACLQDKSQADFAEMLPAADPANQPLEPGDVLVIGPDGQLTRSTEAHQASVVGVYSTRPSYLGNSRFAGQDGYAPLAIVGVVPVKASAENGPIQPGDMLVASATPGHAMRAEPLTLNGVTFYPSGVSIGKALEPLDEETGLIQMLVTLQ